MDIYFAGLNNTVLQPKRDPTYMSRIRRSGNIGCGMGALVEDAPKSRVQGYLRTGVICDGRATVAVALLDLLPLRDGNGRAVSQSRSVPLAQ